jgi:quercetin dioxygenase-like cupin family protein
VKRRTWIAGGLSLVGVIIIVVLLLLPSGGQENRAMVVEAVNKVDAHSRPKDDWRPAAVGMTIYGGGQVRTGGASSARMELLEGVVRLSADSLFTVKESATRQGRLVTVLFLEGGRLWAHVATDRPHEFTVETGSAVATVRDTRFSIKAIGKTTLVSVAEGEVTSTAQGQRVTVKAGEQVTVEKGQPPALPEPMSDEERALWAIEGEMPELAPPTPTPTPTSLRSAPQRRSVLYSMAST